MTNKPKNLATPITDHLSESPVSRTVLMEIQEAKSQQLRKLYLFGRGLTFLPPKLFELRQLKVLDLGGNELTDLPEAITHLQRLTWLDLSFNQLTNLPEAITRLQNLTTLDLSFNQLTNLPEAITRLQNLTTLDLSDNQLTNLPEAITRLQKLKGLNLRGNPIEMPPLEILSLDQNGFANIKKIRQYFRQLNAAGQDYLYEAKLLILGEAGAGKTTLANKIKNSDYQLRDEETTRGIEVLRWEFPLSKDILGASRNLTDMDKSFRVNIWDFGGQEIYHATHQFFLTKRSLYLLVADIRKEDTDFYYWLNVVELLSDNSPLLIIKNEKQDRHRDINERQLRGQFTNLKEVLATNLANNRGLPQILAELKHHLSRLPHVGAALPKTWVKVRQALEENPHNTISLKDYLALCQQHSFTRFEDKLQLSGYLHDLGVCLHFQDDPLLRKTVILKPEWGTAAAYKVLDNPEVIKNLGRFSQADLERIWRESRYANMQPELLQLMRRFQLCYPLPDQPDTYIAPQLLSQNQPEYAWNETHNLYLRYTYEFMPKGILPRFIVAMHPWIADQHYVWRSGVMLHKDQATAEVIEHYGKREIQIRVAGKNKKEMLTIIAWELDKIHASYHRLKYDKLVPCNCPICKAAPQPHFYPFDRLRKFAADRKPIQCPESYEMVEVLSLIDEVLPRESLGLESGESEHWRNLIRTYTRRLQILKEQQVAFGLHPPPEIVMEIEKIEAELKELQS